MSLSSPISPAVDHLTDLALWEAELAAVPPPVVASSLVGRLEQVPDPRDPRGRRHPLVVILVLTACATLVVGNDSRDRDLAVGRRYRQEVLARIGARYDGWTGRYLVPSERTFRRVLTGLDGDALDAAISGYVTDVLRGRRAGTGPRRPWRGRSNANNAGPSPAGDPSGPGRAATGRRGRRETAARLGHRRRAHVSWSPRSTTPPA